MAILSLAWKSLRNRRFTALLTVVSIALSVTLLVGVERLRTEARASFANTLSGTDLIVGAAARLLARGKRGGGRSHLGRQARCFDGHRPVDVVDLRDPRCDLLADRGQIRGVCDLIDRDASTGIPIRAVLITISDVRRPVVYRI